MLCYAMFFAQDHVVRIWTRAPERQASAEVSQAFDKSVIDGQTKSKQVIFVNGHVWMVGLLFVALFFSGVDRLL